MANQSRASVRQAWAERIDRFQKSNQSVAEFCLTEGVSQASLYQWRRKLGSGHAAVNHAAVTQTLPAFVPVNLRASEASLPATVMAVELPGGIRVRIEVAQPSQASS